MKKLLFAIAISLLVLFKGAVVVNAADFNLDCGDSGCTKSGTEPLFDKGIDGFWFPGRTLTKTINLKNSSSATKEMSIRPDRTSEVNILENVVQVSIVTDPGGTVVWAGNLNNFYSQTSISMGIFNSGIDQNYKITAGMDLGADNSYQGLESKFNLTLGFWETATTSEGGGGGGVGGASAPVCNDTSPGGAPTLLQAIAGVNNVQLIWSEGAGPINYYLVAFGLTPGAITYGNTNIGGAGTTSYTVNNLSGGTTYYFRVRAGNGCAPGPFSNELSVTPGGIAVTGPAQGFLPGVLGVENQAEGVTQEVKGVACLNKNYLWWLPLAVEAGFLVVYFYWLRKKRRRTKRWFIIPFAAAAVSQFIHERLGCNCATDQLCNKYLLINLIILMAFFAADRLRKRLKKS